MEGGGVENWITYPPESPLKIPRFQSTLGLFHTLGMNKLKKNKEIKECTKKKQHYHQAPLISKENKAFITKIKP